ncbi:MAG: hypothetical protein JSW34_13225 [Candidatus Zixiibacteriota bacterium]|nr:MAG: hypothetical protein JSW34_13225 [candidate division Zixibacteria bacterium]
MDKRLIRDIKQRMKDHDTSDLQDIWSKQDRNRYSDETFAAVNELLTERGEALPAPVRTAAQKTPNPRLMVERLAFIITVILIFPLPFVLFVDDPRAWYAYPLTLIIVIGVYSFAQFILGEGKLRQEFPYGSIPDWAYKEWNWPLYFKEFLYFLYFLLAFHVAAGLYLLFKWFFSKF